MAGRIYRAREAALASVDGQPRMIAAGATAREGHPLLAAVPGLWEPFAVDYEHEEPGDSGEAEAGEAGAPAAEPADDPPAAPRVPRARGSKTAG